jgi:hypothetical protein
MDREPLGWSVRRHVVDVTFRELDPPRRPSVERFVLVVQAPRAPGEGPREARPEVVPAVRSGEPSPAL